MEHLSIQKYQYAIKKKKKKKTPFSIFIKMFV